MHILLVSNDPSNWEEIVTMVESVADQVTQVHHSELLGVDTTQFDLVVLSGGWWYDDPVELLERYAAELELIRKSTTPIFGICIGMQLMHVAVDQAVPLLDVPQHGFEVINVTAEGQQLFGFDETMRVYKLHTRGVLTADLNFEVLAHSPGHIEIMRHRTRPLLGVQFHPESEETLDQAKALFLKLIAPLVPTD